MLVSCKQPQKMEKVVHVIQFINQSQPLPVSTLNSLKKKKSNEACLFAIQSHTLYSHVFSNSVLGLWMYQQIAKLAGYNWGSPGWQLTTGLQGSAVPCFVRNWWWSLPFRKEHTECGWGAVCHGGIEGEPDCVGLGKTCEAQHSSLVFNITKICSLTACLDFSSEMVKEKIGLLIKLQILGVRVISIL